MLEGNNKLQASIPAQYHTNKTNLYELLQEADKECNAKFHKTCLPIPYVYIYIYQATGRNLFGPPLSKYIFFSGEGVQLLDNYHFYIHTSNSKQNQIFITMSSV